MNTKIQKNAVKTKRIYLAHEDDYETWGLQFADITIYDDRATEDGVSYVVDGFGIYAAGSNELPLTPFYHGVDEIKKDVDSRVEYLWSIFSEDWVKDSAETLLFTSKQGADALGISESQLGEKLKNIASAFEPFNK